MKTQEISHRLYSKRERKRDRERERDRERQRERERMMTGRFKTKRTF
jgi:hypothetical protein